MFAILWVKWDTPISANCVAQIVLDFRRRVWYNQGVRKEQKRRGGGYSPLSGGVCSGTFPQSVFGEYFRRMIRRVFGE